MMRRTERMKAALMAAVFCISAIGTAGCGKKKDDGIIKADSPWYDLTRFEVCSQYKSDDIDFYDNDLVALEDDRLYYMTYGMYKIPDDVDFMTIDMNDYIFVVMDVYDLDGSLWRSFDVQDALLGSGLLPDDVTSWMMGDPCDVRISDGKAIIPFSAMSFPSCENNTYNMIYDLESQSVESVDLILQDDDPDNIYSLSDNGSYSFDGYLVETFTRFMVDAPVYIKVTSPDGTETIYNIKEVLPELVTPFVSEVIYLGEDTALVGFMAGNLVNKYYYTMDLIRGTFEEYREDTSWFSNYFTSCKVAYFENEGYLLTDNNGIKKLDFATKEVTEVFSYDSCNINRYDARSVEVVSMTDDRIILSGSFYRDNYQGHYEMQIEIFILDRCETNPNAGKKILRAATLTEFDYPFCEAVYMFNETDPGYFIVLENKYSLNEMYLSGQISSYSNPFAEDGLAAQTSLSNQLGIDLMAGDGPDIIMNGASFYQLNRDDYLLDLGSDLDTSGLFGNIVDSARVDGRLYQVPLSAGITGIVARRSDIGDDRLGFTFDQYEDFVAGVCNGNDPIDMSRAEFFITCLSTMNGECINGNTVSYDTDQVRQLADYVRDNVNDPDVAFEDQIFEYYDLGGETRGYLRGGHYQQDITFGDILDSYTNDIYDVAILGFPSYDGRGPILTVGSSVAVSAKTGYRDACVEFVRTLLSEDVQDAYAQTDNCIPVRISSFEAISQECLDDMNEQIRQGITFFETFGIRLGDIPSEEIDPSVIGDFEDIISDCSQVASLDPAIMVIVMEEMPAYFEGQKTFDEVVTIMNDRVQTFVNERG